MSSKTTKVRDLTEDQERDREESRRKRQEEINRKREDSREALLSSQENSEKARLASLSAKKKKNSNLSYQIMFGVLGALIVYIIAMSLLNSAPPLHKVPVIENNKIEEHNAHSDWKQGPNSIFEGATLADAKKLVTSGFSNHNNLNKCYTDDTVTPPEHFHVKDLFPKCVLGNTHFNNNSTGKDCSSSYAFALASAISERNCIVNNLEEPVALSAQEILNCDVVNNGCKGGYLNNSLDYLRSKGLSTEACYPYNPDHVDGKCKGVCENPKKTKIDSYCLVMEEENIKREILKNGPVVSTMHIHVDFLTYKGGIYTKGEEVARFSGQHAIKIVGWGVETEGQNIGTKYWIIQNNWGSDWGEDGYARIATGQELFFDQFAYGIKVKAENTAANGSADASKKSNDDAEVNLDLEDK